MLVLTLLLLCASSLASLTRNGKTYYSLEDAEYYFEEFVQTYDKDYYASETEMMKRFEIFKSNLEKINKLNADPNQQHAEFGINKFSDLTVEEFKNVYTCLKVNSKHNSVTFNVSELIPIEAPDSFDWRKQNAVTPVKDQSQCGSCWAFSTTGTLEGAYAIKNKKLLSFSEQQLVDCDRASGNNGCNGGEPYLAIGYIKSAGGIQSEQDYPYTAKEGKCVFDSKKVAAQVTGYKKFELKGDDEIKQSLVQLGPISIGLAGDPLQIYTKGILDCPAGPINHAVLLVGYGTDNGVPYWLIKNSWGQGYGEQGYVRVKVTENPCGMKSYPGVVPEVV